MAQISLRSFLYICTFTIPGTVMLAESEDGLLLDTVQVYSPPVVTVRVCVYCAVVALFNTVSVPSVTAMVSLVQVTVVGPPVEIQVRVISTESNVTPPDILTSPVSGYIYVNVFYCIYLHCCIFPHRTSALLKVHWQYHIDIFHLE